MQVDSNGPVQQPIITTSEQTSEARGVTTAAKSDTAKTSVLKQYLPPLLTGQDKINSFGKAALATVLVITAPVSLLSFAVTTAVIKALATMKQMKELKTEMKGIHNEFKDLTNEIEKVGGIGIEKSGKIYDKSMAELRKAPFTEVSEETASFLLSDKTKFTTDHLRKVNAEMKEILKHSNIEAKVNLNTNIEAIKKDVPESLASTTKPDRTQVAARAQQANEELKAELEELKDKKVETKIRFADQANFSINNETKAVDTKFEKVNIETLKAKETLHKEEFLDGTKVIYNQVLISRPEKGVMNDLFNAIRENIDSRVTNNSHFNKEEMKQNIKVRLKMDSESIEKLKAEPERISAQVLRNREAIAKMNELLLRDPDSNKELSKNIEELRTENKQFSARKNDLMLVLNGLIAASKSIDDLFENPDFLTLANKKIVSEQTTERVRNEPAAEDTEVPKGILRDKDEI